MQFLRHDSGECQQYIFVDNPIKTSTVETGHGEKQRNWQKAAEILFATHQP